MERFYNLTDAGDSDETVFATDGRHDRIITRGNNDDVLKANYEGRKEDGFDITHSFRRVAHIDLGTVRLLAYVNHDQDAKAYIENHDTDARDRMIRRYPDLFKACSGGV